MHHDAEKLSQWLAQLGQQSIEEAVENLHKCFDFFANAGLPAPRLVPLLERVRATLPAEIARLGKAYYADRPLPLAPAERSMHSSMQSLFDKLSNLYWECCLQFEGNAASDSRNRNQAGTLQRGVHAMVSRMIEDFRARQVITSATWLTLRRMVEKAHALEIASIPTTDALNAGQSSTIATTYGRAVLLAAAQAGAMPARHLDATLALTGLLEPFIDCSWEEDDPPAPAAPQAPGATPSLKKTMRLEVLKTGRLRVLTVAGMRHFLNNTRLAGALTACSQKLAAGEPVASLDVLPISRTEVAGLLARLHRVWCGTAEIRTTPRERTNEDASAASGTYAIYKLANGANFSIPKEFHVYSTSGRPGDAQAAKPSNLAETGDSRPWRILDRSGEGLRATRESEGGRLMRTCLMGIRTESAGELAEFSLGEVRWVQEDAAAASPAIAAGIKLLPGKVQAGIMRGFGGIDGKMYQDVAPAFILENKVAPKLVVPTGWWKEDRIIDFYQAGKISHYRMGEMILRGADFETGRFTVEKNVPQR